MGFKQNKDKQQTGGDAKATTKTKPKQANPLTAEALGAAPTETEIAIQKAIQFRKWAKKVNLWIHPHVDIMVPVKNMGYGVVAIKPVPQGETIFSVPPGAYIDPTDMEVAGIPSAKAIDSHRPLIPDWTRSVLRLMAERAKNGKSLLQPWLDCAVVPSDHMFNVNPEDDANDDLRHRVVKGHSGVAQQLNDFELTKRYADIKSFLRQHPEIWPEENGGNSFKLFKECGAFVASRNFHIESRKRPGPFLVPAVDFLNHSSIGKQQVQFILTGGREKGLTFEVRALSDLKEGRQIFHDYGALSNSRLLVEFGFTLKDYQDDSVRLSQRTFVDLAALVHEKELQQQQQEGKGKGGDAAVSKEDLLERITFLTRLGVLFEEGLFILKGASANPSSLKFGEPEQVLLDVMYCLSLKTQGEWSSLKGKIARWWHVSGKSELIGASVFAQKALELMVESYPSVPPVAEGEEEDANLKQCIRCEVSKIKVAIQFLKSKQEQQQQQTNSGSSSGHESVSTAPPPLVDDKNNAEEDDWETDEEEDD